MNARKTVVEALCKVENNGAYSNIVLNELFSKNSEINERDKSFISALFYGVLDRKLTLDYYINSVSKVKIKKMLPLTRQSLRIGVFQIVFMDKIPVSAAVNESVNIIKHSNERKNSALVNAVLRNISRKLPDLPKCDTAENISVVCSCPLELVNGFIKDYGKTKTVEILKSFFNSADTFVRINTCKTDKEGLEKSFSDSGIEFENTDDEYSLKIKSMQNLFLSSAYKEGLFYVQDTASQKCAKAVAANPNDRILDLCAAPGGKSFSIAQDMKNIGEIVSCDIHKNRCELIKKNAERLGITCVKTLCNDATVYNSSLGEFDTVLCDVPCSGWGVIRRKPEIKYKPQTDFSELEKCQKTILEVSAKYVKPFGKLVYSTCTLRKNENENTVNAFLENNTEFILKECVTILPADNCDGFFYAVMQRT